VIVTFLNRFVLFDVKAKEAQAQLKKYRCSDDKS